MNTSRRSFFSKSWSILLVILLFILFLRHHHHRLLLLLLMFYHSFVFLTFFIFLSVFRAVRKELYNVYIKAQKCTYIMIKMVARLRYNYNKQRKDAVTVIKKQILEWQPVYISWTSFSVCFLVILNHYLFCFYQ